MSNPAAVTIGIRTRDRPLLLPRAIESVLAQTFDDWHLVVVNHGGDQEQLASTIAPYADRLAGRLSVDEVDAGASIGVASNAVINRPLGEFFAHHDDDDGWDPEFLARTVELLRSSGADVLAVATQFIRLTEKITADGVIETVASRVDNPDFEFVSFQSAFMGCPAPPIAMLYRSAALDLAGGYDEALALGDDWEFQLRVLSRGRIAVIPEPLATRHERASNDAYGNLSLQRGLVAASNREIRDRFAERPMRDGEIDVSSVALAISELDRENHARVNEALDHVRILRLQMGDVDHQTKHVLGLLERYDAMFRALRMLLMPVIWLRRIRGRRIERRRARK